MGEDSHRGGVTLPEDCWAWLRATADRDGSTRDDLLEGLVRLYMDADEVPVEPRMIERTVSAYILKGSNLLKILDASLTRLDVRAKLSTMRQPIDGIPTDTTIWGVLSAGVAVMTANATRTGNLTLKIAQRQ